MAHKLTPLQERFAQEYVIDLNGSKAAKRAGSRAKDITAAGASFLANPNVRLRIDELKAKRSEKTAIDAEWVLKRLAAEAEADIADIYSLDGHLLPVHEWPKIWRQGLVAGIATKEIEVEGVKMGEIKNVRTSDRIRRLELIGKHIGVNAFQDVVKHTGLDGLADRLARAKERE